MGSDRFYEDERPSRRVRVDTFWIDEAPVTNAQFAAFVAASDYVTVAERVPDERLYPDLDPSLRQPASLVFRPTDGAVALDDWSQWWAFVPGADWRHPTGPDSDIVGLDDHPVVQVAYADVDAYARWAGKALPTEAEWEFAARGGLDGADYAWGDEFRPDGQAMANTWEGQFPFRSTKAGGFRTSPVRRYPPNGYGLHDMIGNVWEWTRDWYAPRPRRKAGCCDVSNPRGGSVGDSYDPDDRERRIGRRVLKGGSHLCAPSYCQRYRPAARSPQTVDSATSHIGFRCVVRRDPG